MLNDPRQLVNANGNGHLSGAGFNGMNARSALSVVVNGLNSVNMSDAPHPSSAAAAATATSAAAVVARKNSNNMLAMNGNSNISGSGSNKCSCSNSIASGEPSECG